MADWVRWGIRSFSSLEQALWLISTLIAGALLIKGQLADSSSSFFISALYSMLYLVVLLCIFVSIRVLQGNGTSLWALVSDRRKPVRQSFVLLLIPIGACATVDLVRSLMSLQASTLFNAQSPTIWIYAFSLIISTIVVRRHHRDLPLADVVSATTESKTDVAQNGRKLLPEADVARIYAKLEKALDVELLYRDPDLTMRQLSDAVGVTEHRVSEVLNQHQ